MAVEVEDVLLLAVEHLGSLALRDDLLGRQLVGGVGRRKQNGGDGRSGHE
jgi:hypothetical protein